jgi:effector-binding domain-containing protein
MLSEPMIIQREAQPYVAITERVTMSDLTETLPEVYPRVGAWLSERALRQAGAPFWKYDVIDMDNTMEVEVAVPVFEPVEGDDDVRAGLVPAGRFVTASFTGHPAGLREATAALLAWGAEHDVAWDMASTDVGEVWGARLEIYESAGEPDMAKWVTTLAFRLVD